jgi:hypothetical protein
VGIRSFDVHFAAQFDDPALGGHEFVQIADGEV